MLSSVIQRKSRVSANCEGSADELQGANELDAYEKLLLAECWKHLHIGQWELFRAHMLTFLDKTKDKLGKESVLQILNVVFESPELFCKGSLHIKKPQDIFWLCASLYSEISNDSSKAKNILFDAELRYILSDLCDIYPDFYGIIKDLYFTFNPLRNRDEISLIKVSSTGQQFLVELLRKNPKFGISLLSHLLKHKEIFSRYNYFCLLWCLYEAMNQLLTAFEFGVNRSQDGEIDELEEDRKAFYFLLQEYGVFSLVYIDDIKKCDLNTSPEDEVYLTAFKDDVEKIIIRIWQVCERGMLDRDAVFFSILCYDDINLLQRFCSVENESKNRLIRSNSIETAENFLRLIHDRNGQINIKEICLYSIVNKVHFLEFIVLNCVYLISCGEYILTCRFLQDPLLSRLKPLIFLLAWGKLKTIPDLAMLCEFYDRLFSNFTDGTDPDLNAICKELVSKADLIRWLLRRCNLKNKNSERKIRNAVDILQNLYNFSNLNIVRECVYLEEIDRSHLFSILEGTILDDEKSNAGSAIFIEKGMQDLSLQEIRDKMVLRSFYILYDASLIVLNGTRLEDMLSRASEEDDAFFIDIENFYKNFIVKMLHSLKEELNRLFPLSYRVEILENLFSYLFLTHQNISEAWLDSSMSMDGSDEGYDDDEKLMDAKVGMRKFLKKKPGRKVSRDQNSSENASSWTTGSFGSKPSGVGFLMNELVIRDFLDFMKESVFNASLTFNEMKTNEDLKLSEHRFQCSINSSITFDSLTKHLNRLSQYVSEALWKFQLVTDSWIPKSAGEFPVKALIKKRKVQINPTVQLYDGASDDEDSIESPTNREGSVEEDVSKQSGAQFSTIKKDLKSTSRRHQRKKSAKPNFKLQHKSVISQMLSSHDSLLNYCLQENLLVKAGQVIKIAGMENTLKAIEVEFATGYEYVVSKLQEKSNASEAQSSDQQNTTDNCASAWDSIMKAAYSARGTLAANESVMVDELLATYQVPFINEVNILELKPILANWLPEQIDWRALVRADLALVACSKPAAAKNLLQAAYLAFRNADSPKTTRKSKLYDQKGQTIGLFIKELLAIITKLYLDEDNEKEVHYLLKDGIRGLLLQGLKPLSYKQHKKMKDMFDNLNICVNHLSQFLDWNQTATETVDVSNLFNCSGESSISQHEVYSIYNRFIKGVNTIKNFFVDNRLARVEEKWNSTVVKRVPAYLLTLFEYVSYLNTMLSSFGGDNSSDNGNLFEVLRYSPSAILEQLLFTKGIPPAKLEEFASRLNIDIVRTIIECSCPHIPLTATELEGRSEADRIVNWRSTRWKSLPSSLLDYVQEKCWLLAVVIRAMTTFSKPSTDDSSAYNGDLAILYPVLYRFLERRLLTDDNSLHALAPSVPIVTVKTRLEEYIKNNDWQQALNYMTCWECQHPRMKLIETQLKDIIYANLASSSNDTTLPWTFPLRMNSFEERVAAVKSNYMKWSAKGALVALNSCIIDQNSNEEITLLIKQVEVCYSIAEEISLMEMNNAEYVPDNITSWQDIHSCLQNPQSQVDLIRNLFENKKYDLISQCSHCYSLDDVLEKVVADSFVLALLQVSLIDQSTLHSTLERCADINQRFSVCSKILEHICENSSNAFALLSVLENENFFGIDKEDFNLFIENKIGVKIFLSLSEEDRSEYIHLIKYPHVMIEQLLIDIKIETLQRAFHGIRDDLKFLPDDHHLSFKSINDILKVYASKAVDFRVADINTEVYNNANIKEKGETAESFIIPNFVPTKSQWVPDSAVSNCMMCSSERFSMFNRRHHCRRCGRVVCGNCSQQKSVVDGYGDVPVRVCDLCYESCSCSLVTEIYPNETPTSLERRLQESLTSAKSRRSSKSRHLSKSSTMESSLEKIKNFNSKLSINEVHNLTVREEFSYEQAPNIPLYLLIYDVYWDSHESANAHLQLANTLIKFLQPAAPGLSNSEIDYNLVINMLKSVLLNAKVKFSKSFDNAGVLVCDHYLSLADLFKLLVSANCTYLIPGGDLNKSETIRKLCDALIKEERWNLALEVATKGFLDGVGVWAAWGMVCLRGGYFPAARDKFSHCLKPLNKSSRSTLQNCGLLKQILECLERYNITDDKQITAVAASLSRLKAIRLGNCQPTTSLYTEGKLHPKIMSECLFYLQVYGNHEMNLEFYVKCNDWDAVLNYVLEHNCTANTFVDVVLVSSFKRGYFTNLLNKMAVLDSTLEKWSNYLIASCRHLQNGDFNNALLELQIFLQDYARAAMTCIKFYQYGAKSYVDLHQRLSHLENAKQHLEAYQNLMEQKHNNKSSLKNSNLKLSSEELQKHIQSINLQVEITQFLFERVDRWQSISRRSSLNSSSNISVRTLSGEQTDPTECPTVFGSAKCRAYLFVMIILSGYAAEEGFNLAVRLISDYKLISVNVYSLLMKGLIESDRIIDICKVVICMKTIGNVDNNLSDKVLLKAISFAASRGHTGKDFDPLLKLIVIDTNKIDACILSGKLKSAYLMAVKSDASDAVVRISEEAERIGQVSVKALCKKWLALKQK